MNKGRGLLVAVIIMVAFVLAGCDSTGTGGGTFNSNGATSGTITITSVSPSTGLTDGTYTSFTVAVEYTAVGGRAELDVGFNNQDNINVYSMIGDVVVEEGSGSHTFNVSATTKDWAAEGDFEVTVGISEYPHGDTWSPLDNDWQVLTFGGI